MKKYEKKDEKKKDSSNKEKADSSNIGDDTIRVETDLVVSDTLVVNREGNVISGLKQSDFIVYEDGEKQEIELFSFGEKSRVPRSFVLIIENGGIPSFMERSIEAAKKRSQILTGNGKKSP